MTGTQEDVTNMNMNIYFGCNEGGPCCEHALGSWTPGAVYAAGSHEYYQMTLASVDEKYQIRSATHNNNWIWCVVCFACCLSTEGTQLGGYL